MASPPKRRLQTAGESENQLTIEQLAQRTGLSVRNIRSHQARGLLPPPEVRSRVGYYGPEHEARLRLIRELQDEGLKLEGVRRVLDQSRSAGEGLLRVREAAEATAEREEPEVIRLSELQERFGLDEERGAALLAKAERLALLTPLGDELYEAASPSLIDAAEEAHRLGMDLEHTIEAIASVERHATTVARRFVKLFMDDVWSPFAEAGMPEEAWPEIADAIERLRPIAASALLAVFRRSMAREVDATFAEIARRLSKGKR